MCRKEITSFVAAALLSCTNASAQSPWEGGIKADGAWNFRQSNNENLDFKLKYNKEKFFVGTSLYFGHNFYLSNK